MEDKTELFVCSSIVQANAEQSEQITCFQASTLFSGEYSGAKQLKETGI